MSTVKIMVNGNVEEIDRHMFECGQALAKLEREVLSLIISHDETEDVFTQLDALRDNRYFDKISWEGFVTTLTNDIKERCDEFDMHVSVSTDDDCLAE